MKMNLQIPYDYILDTFSFNFAVFQNKRIALYGIGSNTEIILNEFSNYNFVALLDPNTIGEMRWGKSIIAYQELTNYKVDVVIIVARTCFVNLIYKRIEAYCSTNHIRVFDINGVDLQTGYKKETDYPFYSITEQDALKKIDRYPIILFDIFDVLYHSKIRNADINLLIRENGEELVKYAFHNKKQIYFVWNSDDIQNKALREHIDTYYKGYHSKIIFKSSENSGYFKDTLYFTANNFLKLENIFLIKKSLDMLYMSRAENFFKLDLDDHAKYMLELSASKMFSDPFTLNKTQGKLYAKNNYNLGYSYLGPIVTQFMLWLKDEALTNKYDCVCFASRDGYLFSQMYQILKNHDFGVPLPDAKYLYTSRICATISNLSSDRDLIFAYNLPFSGPIEKMLENRFFIDKSKIRDKKPEESDIEYLLGYKDLIIENSKQYQENYTAYLNNELCHYKKITFVDFSSSGTCQYYIEKLIHSKLFGSYFYHVVTNCYEKEKLSIKAMYKNENELYSNSWFARRYILLEGIITSLEPTVKYFNREMKCVFLEEKRSSLTIQEIQEIHNGIIAFFNDYLQVYQTGSLSLKMADKMLQMISEKYSDINSTLINSFELEDEFANRSFKLKDVME